MSYKTDTPINCSCCKFLTSVDKAVHELRRTRAVLCFTFCAVLFLALGYLVLLMRGNPLSGLPHIVRETLRVGSVGFMCAPLLGVMYCAKPFEWPPKNRNMREGPLRPSVGWPDQATADGHREVPQKALSSR